MSGQVSRLKALIYALIALAIGGASYAVGVGSLLGQRAEASVLDAASFTVSPPAPLSLVSPWSVAGTIAVLALLAWAIHGFARGLWLALFSIAAILGSQLLKQQVLTRPDLFAFDAPNTFPSGHMTVFAVVAGGLIWACAAQWRGCIGLLMAALVGIVAWQLLAYGWHRPSDVLGAQALGVLAFACAALLRLPRGARTIRIAGSASSAINAVLGVAIALAGIALVLGGIVMALMAAASSSDSLMLSAGQIALIGTGALSVRAMMSLAK